MATKPRPENLAVHAGRDVDVTKGELAPAIQLSTTFVRDADGGYTRGYDYGRTASPGRASLERALAALENGEAGAAFASGTAATLAVFQAMPPGSHVVATDDCYHGTRKQLNELVAEWGYSATFVDTRDIDAVAGAFRDDTTLLWVETPSNPSLAISDLAALSTLAHERGASIACDNTYATPVVQRPLEVGADLVVHSTTKYIGGHSDVMGGAVIGRDDNVLFDRIRRFQHAGGAVPSAFDCWLLLRSLATLPVRVRAQNASAARIADWLDEHPHIERALYPGLATHPGHALAETQMDGFGAMVSLCVAGGRDEAMAVAARTRLFTRATSLGGVESLIEHRASIEGPDTPTPQNLLRLSIGLEHTDDLIEDLDQALAGPGATRC